MRTTLFTALLLMVAVGLLFGQGDIINTIATGGTFSIKDGSTTFLSLAQSDGSLVLSNNVSLPVSTGATLGVLFKGTDRFFHDFKASGRDGYNTFIGVNSGNFTMAGTIATHASYNTAAGHTTLTSLTSGFTNSAFGYSALSLTSSGYQNAAFGAYALTNNLTGTDNSGFGALALYENSIGTGNSAFGSQALLNNVSGNGNSAFGTAALQNNIASNNTAFGGSALLSNTTGTSNCAFGPTALYANTSGGGSSAFGYEALLSNTTNGSNSAFGYWALRATTGSNNTAIGYQAGYSLTSGSNNTFVGNGAIPSSTTISNEFVLGNASVSSLRCNVQNITTLSDRRDKREIEDIRIGLDFLMTIRPRQFHWDRREWYAKGESDGSKAEEKPTAGFIAQELDEAQTAANAEWLNLVLKSNPERMEATPGNLLPIMVKAIQELKAENDDLRRELEKMKERQEKWATERNNEGTNQRQDETSKVSLNEN